MLLRLGPTIDSHTVGARWFQTVQAKPLTPGPSDLWIAPLYATANMLSMNSQGCWKDMRGPLNWPASPPSGL